MNEKELAKQAARQQFDEEAAAACEQAGRGLAQVFERIQLGLSDTKTLQDLLVTQKYVNDAAFIISMKLQMDAPVAPEDIPQIITG